MIESKSISSNNNPKINSYQDTKDSFLNESFNTSNIKKSSTINSSFSKLNKCLSFSRQKDTINNKKNEKIEKLKALKSKFNDCSFNLDSSKIDNNYFTSTYKEENNSSKVIEAIDEEEVDKLIKIQDYDSISILITSRRKNINPDESFYFLETLDFPSQDLPNHFVQYNF